MGVLGDITIQLRANAAAFSKDMKDAAEDVKALKSAFKEAGIIAAEASAVMGEVAHEAIKAAAEAQTLGLKLDRVFGEGASGIEDWAKATAHAMGTGTEDIKKGAAGIGNVLGGAMDDKGQVAGLSKELVKLAVDASAASGTGLEDSLGAVSAALLGSTRSLRTFGVSVTEADVKNALLAKGFQGTITQLDDQSQMAVRAGIIMQKLAQFTGASERAAGTFTGQMKLMKGTLEDAAGELGTAMLPAATALAGKITDLAHAFESLSPETKQLIGQGVLVVGGLAGIAASGIGAALAVSKIVGVAVELAPLFGTVASGAISLGSSFITGLAGPAGSLLGSGGAFSAMEGGLINLVGYLGDAGLAVGVFATTFTVMSSVLKAFGVENTGAQGAVTAWASITDSLGEGFKGVAKIVVSAIGAILESIVQVLQFAHLLGPGASDALAAMGVAASEVIDKIGGLGTATAVVNEMGQSMETTEGIQQKLTLSAAAMGDAQAKAFEKAKKAAEEFQKIQQEAAKSAGEATAGTGTAATISGAASDAAKLRTQALTTSMAGQSALGGPSAAIAAFGKTIDDINTGLEGKIKASLEAAPVDDFAAAYRAAVTALGTAGKSADDIAKFMAGLKIKNTEGPAQATPADFAAMAAAAVEMTKQTDAASLSLKQMGNRFPSVIAAEEAARVAIVAMNKAATDAGADEGTRARVLAVIEQANIAAEARAIASTDGMSVAYKEAKARAEALGQSFTEVDKAIGQLNFDNIQSDTGPGLSKLISSGIFNSIRGLFSSGDQGVGKGLSELIGGQAASAASGGPVDPGAIIGGIAGSVIPGIGTAVGAAVGSTISAAVGKLGDSIKGALGSIIGDSRVQSAVTAGADAAGPAMLLGPAVMAIAGVTAGMFNLITQTKEWGTIQASVSEIVTNTLIPALEPLAKMFAGIVPLFAGLVAVMMPFITQMSSSTVVAGLVFDVLKALALGLGTLAVYVFSAGNMILLMVQVIATAIASVMDVVAHVLTFIPGMNNEVDMLRAFAAGLRDAGAAAASMAAPTGEMAAALAKLAATTNPVAGSSGSLMGRLDPIAVMATGHLTLLASAVADTVTAFKALNDESRNVSSNFKVSRARFEAADAVTPPGVGGGNDDRGSQPAGRIQIGSLVVKANNVNELEIQLTELQRRGNWHQYGSPHADGGNHGRD